MRSLQIPSVTLRISGPRVLEAGHASYVNDANIILTACKHRPTGSWPLLHRRGSWLQYKKWKNYKLDCYLFVLQLYLHYTYISKADALSKLTAAGSCIIAAGICFLLGVPKWLIDRSTDDWAMNFGEGPKTQHLMNNLYLREWRGCRGSMRSLLLSRVLCPP